MFITDVPTVTVVSKYPDLNAPDVVLPTSNELSVPAKILLLTTAFAKSITTVFAPLPICITLLPDPAVAAPVNLAAFVIVRLADPNELAVKVVSSGNVADTPTCK